MNQSHDTASASDGMAPPPRWLMILLATVMITPILIGVTGIFIFRDVLTPGRQQRVINRVPIMVVFLPARPVAGSVLPTAVMDDQQPLDPNMLLGLAATNTPLTTATTIPLTPTLPVTSTTQPTVTTAALPTMIPSLAPSATVTIPVVSVPSSARMYGFRHELQTWNNCGPASLTTALSYYGWQEPQTVAQSYLRPNREDKNVRPDEMVTYVNQSTGVEALWRVGGDLDLLRLLVANDFPVLIGTGYAPEGEDWLGHYQPVIAYEGNTFYVYDTYLGTGENDAGIPRTATDVDRDWRHFNRRFIVLYPPERRVVLDNLLGERDDEQTAYEVALAVAQSEARANPQDGFAWFNVGTSLVALGRYEEAASAFDVARQRGLPWRMLWYQFDPYEAYYETGRYSDVIALVEGNLQNGGEYVEETFYWQGRVLEARGETQDAVNAYRRALRFNPNFEAAQVALDAIS